MRARQLLAASVAAALAGGCNFIIGIEHDYEVGARHVAGDTGGAGGSAEESTASSSSVASSSGSTSSSSGSGASSGCPDAAMIDVGAFCVDATEVTNAAYAAWLATAPTVAGQPSFCAWNGDFAPASGWPPSPSKANEPVVGVDWCDAFAYCAAAGKRLCGRIGGGSLDYAFGFADPEESEWMAVCTNGGSTKYPYGDGYVSGACDGKDYTHPNETVAVGSAAVCHGAAAPYAAIFDLSGNVAEWEDACAGTSGAGDLCRRRGGSFKDGSGALRCAADSGLARSSAGATTGFRCCGG